MRKRTEEIIAGHRLEPESLSMGYGYRPEWSEGSIKSPIFQTSTFVFQTAEEGKHFFEIATGQVEAEEGETPGMIYSRLNNPDLEILEDRLCLWEDAEMGLVFASGMAAITAPAPSCSTASRSTEGPPISSTRRCPSSGSSRFRSVPA